MITYSIIVLALEFEPIFAHFHGKNFKYNVEELTWGITGRITE